MTIVSFFSKLLASLMRNYFPKRQSGTALHNLSNIYILVEVSIYIIVCSRWFYSLSPHLRQFIALYAVAKGWLLLDIGWFVLFWQANLATCYEFNFGSKSAIRLTFLLDQSLSEKKKSYIESPYTNRNYSKMSHQNPRLHNDCGTTQDDQLVQRQPRHRCCKTGLRDPNLPTNRKSCDTHLKVCK